MDQAATQPPSEQRVQEARLHGYVPRAGWLPTAAALALLCTLSLAWGASLWALLQRALRQVLVAGPADLSVLATLREAIVGHAAGLLALLWLAVAIVEVVQVGPLVAHRVYAPRFRAAAPSSVGRRRQRLRVWAGSGLLLCALWLLAWPSALALVLQAPRALAASLHHGGVWVLGVLAAALLAFGVVEFAFDRARWWQSLRLGASALRRAARQDYGAPEVRLELARRRRAEGRT